MKLLNFNNIKNFKCLIIFFVLLSANNSYAIMKALNTASTGMSAQDQNVATIANNIANVNTIGYKKRRVEFQSLMYQTIQEAGSRSSFDTRYNVGIQIGSGAKVAAIRKEFTTGNPKITNNPFDFMVSGDGFFGVMLPNQQVRYTRDGSFNVNKEGIIVNSEGYILVPSIQVPPNSTTVSVAENGIVQAFVKNQLTPVNIGQIPVFTFTNSVGLKSIGKNLYQPTMSSGVPISNIAGENSSGSIMQGALETSNVSIMNEMTNLIKAQRAYEMNSRVMKVADEMLQTINNLK